MALAKFMPVEVEKSNCKSKSVESSNNIRHNEKEFADKNSQVPLFCH